MKSELSGYVIACCAGFALIVMATGVHLWLAHDPMQSCKSACNDEMKSYSVDGICECRDMEITE